VETEHRPDQLGGVTVVRLTGRSGRARAPVPITAIPYFAWANRGIAPMRVWLPTI
jgi:uncharacterized protein